MVQHNLQRRDHACTLAHMLRYYAYNVELLTVDFIVVYRESQLQPNHDDDEARAKKKLKYIHTHMIIHIKTYLKAGGCM